MFTTDRMDPHARTWGEPIYLTRSAVADLTPEQVDEMTQTYREMLEAGIDAGSISASMRAVVRLSELGGYRP